ncbi:MAG: DUF1080 domain-containing protein [Sphingobacterium sp.]
MKKIFNTITALLFIQVAAYGQQPTSRTTATKIADVLAQQPAEEQSKFLLAMKELEGFTSEDVAGLLGRLQPQGGDNAAIEYATNSYAFYVMQPNRDGQRATYVQGLLSALDQVEDKDNKAYVLELLKFCAKDEAVDGVAAYLTDEYLVEKAARVLNAIASPAAASALNSALATVSSEAEATAIIAALGNLQTEDAEQKIIELLGQFEEDNFQLNGLTALSQIAGPNSDRLFLDRAKAVDYQYEKTNAASLAVDYAQHLLEKGQDAQASKFARKLYKQAGSAKASTIQAGALGILTQISPAKQKRQLIKLASSDDKVLRNVALGLLADEATAKDLAKLAGSLRKLDGEAQESVLHFLADQQDAVPTIEVIEGNYPRLQEEDARIAALNALTVLSKGNNTPFLIGLIPEASEGELQAIQTLLLSSQGDNTVQEINGALSGSDAKTQALLLGVLAQRRNAESASVVLPLTGSADQSVRAAAYNALPTVVNANDLEAVIGLLAAAEGDELKAVQRAAIFAIKADEDRDGKIQKLAGNISRSSAPSAGKFFPIFAGVGGTDALKAVENYLGNDGLKNQAVSSLANWSNAESLPILVRLVKTEKDPTIFGSAFTGMIKQLNASDENADQKTLLLKDAFARAQDTKQKQAILTNLQTTGTYQSLMFASSFMDDAELGGTATNVAMNIAMDHKEFIGAEVREILDQAAGSLSGSESSYLKEAIVRHLAEMPAGEGYVPIFNGKDLDGWKGLVENPIARQEMGAAELEKKQAEADRKMRENWSAENGDLVFSGHGDNIATIKKYGDFEMLVDWKLDPNGEEPDAGIYLRGTPQVQIWDVSRTEVGAQVGSGGLYNNTEHPKDPLTVADNELGEWNTFKIRMVGEDVSVWLNGELVVDSVPLENYWDRNQSIFPEEQIELQAHGSQVWYRDIYVKEIARKEVHTLSQEEQADEFEMLFNGEDLDKWTSSPAYEITPEGYIRSNPDAKFGKNIYTKEEYDDFVYRFEFKLTPGANNGVGIRTPIEGDAAYAGMEIQVLDDDADVYKDLEAYQYHGSVYGIIAAKRGSLNPLGEWNTQEIRVQGSKIKVTVNGQVIVDGDLTEASKAGTADKKSHPGLQNQSGHIGFLGHGTEVFFRNIRIKRL